MKIFKSTDRQTKVEGGALTKSKPRKPFNAPLVVKITIYVKIAGLWTFGNFRK